MALALVIDAGAAGAGGGGGVSAASVGCIACVACIAAAGVVLEPGLLAAVVLDPPCER
jgi:hypothetical protein